jgi:hypothetical protein
VSKHTDNAMFKGAVGTITPVPLCPRTKTNAKPSVRTIFVLGISTMTWLAQLVISVVLYSTTTGRMPYLEMRYAAIALGALAW